MEELCTREVVGNALYWRVVVRALHKEGSLVGRTTFLSPKRYLPLHPMQYTLLNTEQY